MTAGPNRAPTDSVATPTSQAMPASATAARTKTAVGDASVYCSTPVTAVTTATAPATTRMRFTGSARPREAHPLVHRLERRRRGRARLVRADREQPPQLALVRAQLAVALLDRRDQRDDRLADRLLELAVAGVRRTAPRSPRAVSPVATDMMSIRFVIPGLSSARRTSRPESVTAVLNFFRITSGLVHQRDRALLGAARRRHLLRRLLEVHDPRADLRVHALRARRTSRRSAS